MNLQIKKSKDRICIPAFLEYVRTLECEDCKALRIKQTTRTTASHLVSVKWADGSDATAVPQCLLHHPQSTGQAELLLIIHGVDVEELHRRLWKGFLAEHGMHCDVLTQEHFECLCREAGFVKEAFTRRKNR